MLVLLLSLPVLLLLNLMWGSVSVPVEAVWQVLMGRGEGQDVWHAIVWELRLPQALTAMACGAGLSVAGLELQTLFHNPLAGPSVMGVSSAAAMGVALVVLTGGGLGLGVMSSWGVATHVSLTLAAVGGSLLMLLVLLGIARRVDQRVTLLVAGVLMGYIASAVVGVLKYFATEEDIRSFVIWGLGSFSRVSGGAVWLFVGLMSVLLPLTLLLAKPLNLLLLGEDYAMNLGLNLRRARMLIVFSAGALTAVVTAYCGPIMFLGLAVPHMVRGVLRSEDHRLLLPGVLMGGAALALLCNLVCRLPGTDGTLPVNSVTALMGAPVALSVLLRRRG